MIDAKRDFDVLAYWSGDTSRDASAAVIRRVRRAFLLGGGSVGATSSSVAGAARDGLAAERAWLKFRERLLQSLGDPPSRVFAKDGIKRVYEVTPPPPPPSLPRGDEEPQGVIAATASTVGDSTRRLDRVVTFHIEGEGNVAGSTGAARSSTHSTSPTSTAPDFPSSPALDAQPSPPPPREEVIDGWTWRRVRRVTDLVPGGRYVCTGSEPKERRSLPVALMTLTAAASTAPTTAATGRRRHIRRAATAPAP